MTLREYVAKEILPRYDSFDGAHTRRHVENVIKASDSLAVTCGADRDMCFAVAAYHDLGLVAGREFHHVESGKILATDKHLREWFTEDRIQVMKEAVEDHRASLGREPRSIYGKIVSEADREMDADTCLRRTVIYGLDNCPGLSKEDQYRRFCDHLREKYAVGGYLKLWFDDSPARKDLEKLRDVMADGPELRRRFDTIYGEETAARR